MNYSIYSLIKKQNEYINLLINSNKNNNYNNSKYNL